MSNRFVILFQGRSGSTYLSESLASHANVLVHIEPLATLLADAQTQWAKDFFAHQGPAGLQAAGLKTKLSDVLDQTSFAHVLQVAECRILHLNRRNLVKQVVSWFRAEPLFERTTKWNAYDTAQLIPPISLPIAELWNGCKCSQSANGI